MNKLNVVIMGENAEKFLPMCLNSVKGVDKIIYCDGGSKDNSINIAMIAGAIIIENNYDQKDMGMNGKQRNFYLDYLKKHHMGEFCLCLDADEVVDDIKILKEFINNPPEDIKDIISVKMRHFIENFGQEDATVAEHFVPHRLFKIKESLMYPETEHPVLLNTDDMSEYGAMYTGTTIWHLAYCSGVFDIRKRYLSHVKKSEIHTKEFLNDWYHAHLFGTYPKGRINIMDIPDVILNEFFIDRDMIYYSSHNKLETKHFIMASNWIKYFKPKTVLDLGCGLGLFGFALDSYGIDYTGIEKSQWAVDNTTYKHLNIIQGDITKKQDMKDFDLVLVVDVLEHIEEKDLVTVLSHIEQYGNNFLFSLPYIGDPNLNLDPTHKIKKSKDWWVNRLSKFFNITDVPEHFMYGKQMLVGERK